MNLLATIGTPNPSIHYIDRPTVKVIIKKDDKILLLNNGLLPGGGVEEGESDGGAIARELVEEIGATVKDVEFIGTVVQYRNFLSKRYTVSGYAASLASIGEPTTPKDKGEAKFNTVWLTINQVLEQVADSIAEAKLSPINNDLNQGRLYNLMTAYELLKACKKQGI